MSTQAHNWRPFITLLLSIFAFLVVVVGGAVAREVGLLDSMTVKRIASIAIGVVLIVAGNLAPKMRLFHLSAIGRDPDRIVAAERFAGWALVIAGTLVAGLWLIAPGAQTMLISSIAALCAFAAVALNWFMLARGRPRGEGPEDSDEFRAALTKRIALLQILYSLCWVFAFFTADILWGDDATKWMVVLFSVTLPIVAWPLTKLAKPRARS
ncbi:MAG: hypothetical protein KF779_12320 [Hyphomonadaceae bacterium]|nr:hypothetical protein [Hyphomonadaceae bacterium]